MAKEWRLLDLYVDLNENSAFLNPTIQRARMEGRVPDTATFCSIRKIGISLGFYPDYEQENREKYSPEILLARTEGRKFGPLSPGVKRGQPIWKVPRGGLIRAVILVKDGVIQNLLFSGNVLCSPGTALEEMEGWLKGVPLEEGPIRERVQAIYGKPN